jgi:hypothetical protein
MQRGSALLLIRDTRFAGHAKRGWRGKVRRRLARRYLSDEAIPAARHGLDRAALGARLIENTAQRRNLDCQVTVLDHGIGLGRSHDLVLCDEIAGPSDQDAENVERTRANDDAIAAVETE